VSKPLRVLLIEDSEDDALLVLRELRRGGYNPEFERVEDADAVRRALEQSWDIIFSDWSMPRLDAIRALSVVKERGVDVPFIVVSGTVTEETAVEALRGGAHDFLPKDRLTRLIPAVERELREAALRAERKAMQNHLIISDRMASVGTLAAGVAHEINNPLAVLIGNLEFIAKELTAMEEVAAANEGSVPVARLFEIHEPLRDAREASDRVRQIVRDIKVFSRSDEEKRGPVDVHRVIDSSLRMAGNEVRHRARLVKDFGDVPAIDANEARLGQVFLNLIVNAAHAIPEGRANAHEIRVTTRDARPKGVIVEVRDDGTGISPENLDRIFDPFFTTKPVGVGTGLGLAICHRIVNSMGGSITVQSEIGKGTTFRVMLPSTQEELPSAVEPTRAPEGRRARILVVDDEVAVGRAIRRLLSNEHDVEAVKSAREALEIIKTGKPYDVILCDLMMPEMSGMDLHAELFRNARDVADRMVFLTGGAFTGPAREFLDKVPNARFEKPLDGPNVRAMIRERLR
jgi:signal transduction histidine kinase